MADIVCMGELLIDFIPTLSGLSLIEATTFKKAPGGAPANVAVGLSRLGASTAFMGKVGDDDFGRFLKKNLEKNGVDTTPLVFSKDARTALAFVSLTSEGERDFMFYRHPSADMLFEPAEVDENAIRQAKIFHFGSISLITEPSRSATLHAIKVAEETGLIISYDPNLRLPLWPDEEEARNGMLIGSEYADIIKVSEDEIKFLTGEQNVRQGVEHLWHSKLKLLVVTMGDKGCWYFTPTTDGKLPGFNVKTIDTTGAGDGFVAGVLINFLHKPDLLNDVDKLKSALRFANAVGALTTTKLGAIPALPDTASVLKLLKRC